MDSLFGISENHERMMKRIESYLSSKLLEDSDSIDPHEVFLFFTNEGRFTPRDVMEAMDHLGLLPEEVQRKYRQRFSERVWE